ncbi:Alpha/Beta hydrolase protein [Crepidotus variabilis]|uniref:Alpha/Beta hydrolase protein n=1 Tax=Crepidotus variabilis TaxID=179855 RepID=A0A9P6E8M4_9AGAR|nr:Alpha/Beta hydrolase protein [Crepidotus variabilis]
MSKTAPFGTWISPITAESVTKGANGIAEVVIDNATSEVYHVESRPSEGGRSVLVRTATQQDITGPKWNVRTMVQEYGGAPAIVHNGIAYFSHLGDNRVYRISVSQPDKDPQPVTPEGKPYRYACMEIVPEHPHLLIAVLEDHTVDEPAHIQTTIVVINTTDSSITNLQAGADFYALPKVSPKGTRLAWAQWSHPDMPWEGSQIYVADLDVTDEGRLTLSNSRHVAGQKEKISAAYPSWATDDKLIFTSDESGFINPWKYEDGKASPLFSKPMAEDFGHCYWKLSFFPYAILDTLGEVGLFSAVKDGRDVLYAVDLMGGVQPELVINPYVTVEAVQPIPSVDRQFIFIGQTTNEEEAIVQGKLVAPSKIDFVDLKSPSQVLIGGSPLPASFISEPRPLALTLPNDGVLHVVYYSPHNPEYSGSNIPDEKPPCVVNIHGGPTGLAAQGLSWGKQYFTSRGWGWLDVNFRGSSGYGRDYIERMQGKWGVVDVEDTTLAPKILSTKPYDLIDPKRAVVRGGSAGGYSVLSAISHGPDPKFFAAATSLYGISDLCKLAEFTHKFESRYVDHLLGGTIEDIREVYEKRSPINHANKIVVPLLILQGEDDKVVPKGQAEAIYKSIKDRDGVVEYKLYAGEGHGWRQESNMRDAMERELGFYEQILGLKK